MKLKGILGKLLALSVAVLALACSEVDMLSIESEENLESAAVTNEAVGTLTEEQENMLLFIFEEEKMARDVYEYLFDKWGAKVFSNIIQSEQKHKDAIEQLLITYGILYTDADIAGTFTDAYIQELYDSLTASGDESLVAALDVGMFIEDFDIADLGASLLDFENTDVQTVLGNLIKGSENHLRAFYNNQIAIDPSYTYDPSYISNELYTQILSAEGQGSKGRGK